MPGQVLFAYCAALLVQEYAIHAKHSGIPEIKTVLGGFVIRKFLGPWTLVTKSFGLVRLVLYLTLLLSTLTRTGSCCVLGHVARKGGPSGSCSMLLRQHFHKALFQYQ